jgi:hypothetical protein
VGLFTLINNTGHRASGWTEGRESPPAIF